MAKYEYRVCDNYTYIDKINVNPYLAAVDDEKVVLVSVSEDCGPDKEPKYASVYVDENGIEELIKDLTDALAKIRRTRKAKEDIANARVISVEGMPHFRQEDGTWIDGDGVTREHTLITEWKTSYPDSIKIVA